MAGRPALCRAEPCLAAACAVRLATGQSGPSVPWTGGGPLPPPPRRQASCCCTGTSVVPPRTAPGSAATGRASPASADASRSSVRALPPLLSPRFSRPCLTGPSGVSFRRRCCPQPRQPPARLLAAPTSCCLPPLGNSMVAPVSSCLPLLGHSTAVPASNPCHHSATPRPRLPPLDDRASAITVAAGGLGPAPAPARLGRRSSSGRRRGHRDPIWLAGGQIHRRGKQIRIRHGRIHRADHPAVTSCDPPPPRSPQCLPPLGILVGELAPRCRRPCSRPVLPTSCSGGSEAKGRRREGAAVEDFCRPGCPWDRCDADRPECKKSG
ncbi:hypothetical protein DAI22_09g006140 [Oryza sativa Japonica Group]|nr:hypothetical protein DAI22_09g006140 [Oryza sativa Japonica Group]